MVNKSKSKSKRLAPFSIDISKKECPPNELYGKYAGLEHKKRICVDPNLITILSQSRVVEIDPDHASKIAKSISAKGWDHRQAPLAVTRDSRYPNEEKYELLAGHHRYKALTEHCDWPVIPVDIVQFENEESKDDFLFEENFTEDNPKKQPNKQDTAKLVLKMIRSGRIGKNKTAENKEIRKYLEQKNLQRYGVPKKWIEDVIKEVRKTLPFDGNMVVYNADSANEKAKELGISFSGSKNLVISNEFGYVQSSGKMHGNVARCLAHNIANGEQTVIYMYVPQNPNNNKSLTPKTIGKKRKKMLKDFNGFALYILSLYIQAYTDIDVNSVKITKTPIRFGGFLPQDHTLDENGNYKETGLVDENGAPM